MVAVLVAFVEAARQGWLSDVQRDAAGATTSSRIGKTPRDTQREGASQ